MKEQELENLIKEALKIDIKPDRSYLKQVLSSISETDVTENNEVRYNSETFKSSIINNKITEFINIWKSKRIILVPSLILLIFVSISTLSPKSTSADSLAIQKIAEQNEMIEENEIIDDDQVILADFDSPIVDDLSTTTNEL